MILTEVFKTLFLVQGAITVVQLALNNSPTPSEALDLLDTLSDLQTIQDELVARRHQIEEEGVAFPAPDAGALAALTPLISAVESAKLAGIAAQARLDVASEAVSLAMSVLS